MEDILVDIVIIGRNEGNLLAKAISSCLTAAKEFSALGNPSPKMIYVDGQSTDHSLEVAKKFGIKFEVVKGSPNPAIGRHVGFKHCSGKYVFFLDGDMEVNPQWLPVAVQYLEDHPHVAGVAGYCDWEVYQKGKYTKIPNHSGIKKNGQKVTNDVGGAFLYRTVVLRQIGDFDPTMTRVGELEMYLRIFGGGYNLENLTIPMAVHRDYKGSMGIKFLKRSLFTKNIFIPGVIARKAPHNRRVFRLLLRIYWLYIWHPISLILIFSTIYFTFINSISSLWCISILIEIFQLFFAHWLFKNKNLKRSIVSMFTINFYIPAFIFGFLFCWPKVGGYYKNKVKINGY